MNVVNWKIRNKLIYLQKRPESWSQKYLSMADNRSHMDQQNNRRWKAKNDRDLFKEAKIMRVTINDSHKYEETVTTFSIRVTHVL